MAGQNQKLFRISKPDIDQFLKKKRKLRAVFSPRARLKKKKTYIAHFNGRFLVVGTSTWQTGWG